MTKSTLSHLQALESKASHAPWKDDEGLDIFNKGGEWMRCLDDASGDLLLTLPCGFDAKEDPGGIKSTQATNANAELIVAARNALPELLSYIRELEAVVEAAKDALDGIDCGAFVCADDIKDRLRQSLAALEPKSQEDR